MHETTDQRSGIVGVKWFVNTIPIARGTTLCFQGSIDSRIERIIAVGWQGEPNEGTEGQYLGECIVDFQGGLNRVVVPCLSDYFRLGIKSPNRRRLEFIRKVNIPITNTQGTLQLNGSLNMSRDFNLGKFYFKTLIRT